MKTNSIKIFIFTALAFLFSIISINDVKAQQYDDPYGERYYDEDSRYRDRDSNYRDRDREIERRELDRERERLEYERKQLDEEQRAPTAPVKEQCPSGFSPSENKCSVEERRRGCKDMRLPGGLGCVQRR